MTIKDELRLPVEKLNECCTMESYDFKTTKDIDGIKDIIGQRRAKEALNFGLDIRKKGFNIFVAGQWGTGRSTLVNKLVKEKAQKGNAPDDYVYAKDFEKKYNPKVIRLERGEGKKFIDLIYETISFLRKEIENYFSGKDYENAKNEVLYEYKNKTQDIIDELNEIGRIYDFKFKQTEKGIVSIPLSADGQPMSEEEYNSLSDDEYSEMRDRSEELQIESADLFNDIRRLEKEYQDSIEQLNKSVGERIVSYNLIDLRKDYNENETVQKYLDALKGDIVKHINRFINTGKDQSQNPMMLFTKQNTEDFFDRYKLNLFIDNSETDCLPVVFETNPTYQNLVGSIEYTVQMGVRKTDFTHIKPGALHRANGGYLILLAKDILQNPFAWKGLKRALLDEKVTIESMYSSYTAFSASTLKPEPIELDIKVIIVGDPRVYHLLSIYDEEFAKLFKVRADFDYENNRNDKTVLKTAQYISAFCKEHKLRHLTKDAVGKIIEHSSRLASDKRKLSAKLKTVTDIMMEADYFAEKEGKDFIDSNHISKTLKIREYRDNRYEEKIIELFEDGTYLLDVTGKKVGEINGLAVISTGQHSFGKPSKITVSTYKGKKGIVNIEREVRTSGSSHDKGVMILAGYLGDKFAQDKTLAFTANIVFEQLYSGIEGDSASSTELYAILSSLSRLPINQSIAVTGSINQRGDIQPIGGVNEKIEGFYKICKLKGFNGDQGVIIPKQNVKNLILKPEVIEAVERGDFHIYAIENVDQGIEILTGVKAGRENDEGEFPEATVNFLVNKRLDELGTFEDDEEEEEEE